MLLIAIDNEGHLVGVLEGMQDLDVGEGAPHPDPDQFLVEQPGAVGFDHSFNELLPI